MKKLILMTVMMVFGWSAVAAPAAPAAQAAPKKDIGSDFDSLSGNDVILEKARQLQGDVRVNVVQDRLVPRRNRVELSPEYSGQFGTTYVQTENVGLNLNYHINPKWSVGVKYNYSFNTLTAEGESIFNQARADRAANPANPRVLFPEIDYQKSQVMGLVNWYPFYGKVNFFDKVAQFDIYALAGYGTVELSSGSQPTWTGGAGVGLWWSQHLTSRFELRYQNYEAQYYTGAKQIDATIGSLQVGWLL